MAPLRPKPREEIAKCKLQNANCKMQIAKCKFAICILQFAICAALCYEKTRGGVAEAGEEASATHKSNG
jgi:hypothetical protein